MDSLLAVKFFMLWLLPADFFFKIKYFKKLFPEHFQEANNMNPDQTAPLACCLINVVYLKVCAFIRS